MREHRIRQDFFIIALENEFNSVFLENNAYRFVHSGQGVYACVAAGDGGVGVAEDQVKGREGNLRGP